MITKEGKTENCNFDIFINKIDLRFVASTKCFVALVEAALCIRHANDQMPDISGYPFQYRFCNEHINIFGAKERIFTSKKGLIYR